MSPDRLAELRRQRALVAQHLAWIDSELTAAGAGQTSQSVAAPPPTMPSAVLDEPGKSEAPATLAASEDAAIALAQTRADEIIEKYRATEALDPRAAKRGCLALFGAFFAFAGFVILAIYYFRYVRN